MLEEKENELYIAAESGDFNKVKRLIEVDGVNVNCKLYLQRTPLMQAALSGHLQIVEYLTSKGAAINFQAQDGSTALISAAWSGRLEVVKYLLNYNADKNAQDNDGWTPLIWAATHGYLDVVKLLVESGADVCIKNELEKTALDLVTEHKIEDVKNYFLDLQAQGKWPLKLDLFKEEDKIKAGAFGEVFKYRDTIGRNLAVKKIKKESYHDKTEISAMLRLGQHDNVVQYHGQRNIEGKLHLFMELCEGNLKDFICKPLTLKQKHNILIQVANGMSFIHKNRIIHKDLKPANILIKDFDAQEIQVKITDFGLSYPMADDEKTTSLSLSFGGSLPYMAPELVQTQLYGESSFKKDYKVDVWSFGVVTYKVIKGDHPFKFPNNTTKFQADKEIPKDFAAINNQDFLNLLVQIFSQEPTRRPTMKKIHEVLCNITLE